MMSSVAVVDTGRSFLNQAREITALYVEISESPFDVGKAGVERSPALGKRVECDASHVQGGPPPPPNPALTIAERLKVIGDSIDKQVVKELQQALSENLKPTNIFQMQAEHFSNVCRTVLNTCSGYLRNGWEQSAVVFMGVRDILRELRAQGESQGSPRDVMMSGFAGEALEDLHLDAWITSHGGMDHFGQLVEGGNVTVPIEGTEV